MSIHIRVGKSSLRATILGKVENSKKNSKRNRFEAEIKTRKKLSKNAPKNSRGIFGLVCVEALWDLLSLVLSHPLASSFLGSKMRHAKMLKTQKKLKIN